MKRFSLVFLVVLLACSLLVGCSQQGTVKSSTASTTASVSAKTSTSASTQTSTSNTATQSVTLKWTIHVPDNTSLEKFLMDTWSQKVEEETQGRVKVQVFYNSILGKPADVFKMMSGGVADGAYVCTPFVAWEIPLSSGGNFPFLSQGSIVGAKAMWQLYNEWTPLQEEWAKVKAVPVFAFSSHSYKITSTVPIQSLDDLKGKKIYAGSVNGPIIEKFGAVNVTMATADSFDALQKSLISGVILGIHAGKALKLDEVCKYMTGWEFVGGTAINMMAFSQSAWDKISTEDQSAIKQLGLEMRDIYYTQQASDRESLIKYYNEKGIQLIDLSSADQAKVKETCGDIGQADYITKCKEMGVPGEELLSRFKTKVQELSK